MKRYLLFSWSTYYPDGGMNDFVHDYDDLDLARTELLGLTEDHHAVIYDQQERQDRKSVV